MDNAVLVTARGISFARDGRDILTEIDLTLHAGEIVTIIGPNGAGKTTLLRLLLGLARPDTGAVGRAADLVVGYVPQRFDVDRAIPMTVARFLAIGADRGSETLHQSLAQVGAGGLVDRQLAELSGGELQRVLLARALVREPRLLALDEPARGVDHVGEAELYALLSRLRDTRGMGILLISHDLHVVMARSDRVLCINRHLCCEGLPEAVAQHPEYARLFGRDQAEALGIYRHHHDHQHDMAGAPVPLAASAEKPDAGPRSNPDNRASGMD